MNRTRVPLSGLLLAFALLLPGAALADCAVECWILGNYPGRDTCEAYGPNAFCCCTGGGGAFCTEYPVPYNPCDPEATTVEEKLVSPELFLQSLGIPTAVAPAPGPSAAQ